MAALRTYRIAEVAALAGVTVRALHHYDEIGLLTPSIRSKAGYRLYTERDLLRLQQIMIQRELGLPLEHIRRVLDDPTFDLRAALLAQKTALEQRAAQTRALLDAVNAALEHVASPDVHPEKRNETMQDLFRGFDYERYEDETQRRWGQTDAYKESARRTKSYTADDWQRFSEEQNRVYAELAALLKAGVGPGEPKTQDAIERHRSLIDRWFYPCNRDMHANLASMYEADSRFEHNIDKFEPGLTRFLVAAIRHGLGS